MTDEYDIRSLIEKRARLVPTLFYEFDLKAYRRRLCDVCQVFESRRCRHDSSGLNARGDHGRIILIDLKSKQGDTFLEIKALRCKLR